ncbi:MAG: DUF6454 family protein [Blastocatellia bacterium]
MKRTELRVSWRRWGLSFLGLGMIGGAWVAGAAIWSSGIVARFQSLDRSAHWNRVASIALDFDAHHPQGMVRIGETFYLSSVEVRQPTMRYSAPRDGFDRDPGAGTGHLFHVNSEGRLLRDIPLGEGTIYHPGGIDFDGRWLWVAVAEYRPESQSIIYRVDPETMQAWEVWRVKDHLGALACDRSERMLHGVSWGSRRLYRWKVEGERLVAVSPVRRNPSFYVDYQDCHGVSRQRMLCGGVSSYRLPGGAGGVFRLGGLELVDLARGEPLYQLPVEVATAEGLPLTQNPFWIEPYGAGLRGWFIPQDGRGTLLVYDILPRSTSGS